MIWNKQKIIIKPNKNIEWLYNWASASCSIQLKRDENLIYTIYVTGRDSNGRSRIGYIRYDFYLDKLLEVSKKPIIDLGPAGSFDQNGTSYPSVIKTESRYLLFYTGWAQGVQVKWYNGLGLAESKDGLNFTKKSNAPIIHRNNLDYIGIGSSDIKYENNSYWGLFTRFESWDNEGVFHKYNIKFGNSNDGLNWSLSERPVIDFKSQNEYAIAKPSILIYKGIYLAWYCYRGDRYKIGFSASTNKVTWYRFDNLLGLDISEKTWENEMVCYPFVFQTKEKIIMLYNGNGYGSSGLGYATLEKSIFDNAINKIIIELNEKN